MLKKLVSNLQGLKNYTYETLLAIAKRHVMFNNVVCVFEIQQEILRYGF